MTELLTTTPAGTPRKLADRYRLERRLASGGMAEVWSAVDEVLARRVAVKILHRHLAADPTFVARFRQEAVAVARLIHPSIVSVYDTVSDDGVEAIVMELVEGCTLRQHLDDRGVLSPEETVNIAEQLADALDLAHRAGVVHRDIKPANIMVCPDGRALLTDFGIAKQEAIDLTATGHLLGTAKYLAPEQVTGAPLDGRADLYALGIVIYESLCGKVPFEADSDAATALLRLRRDPDAPRHLRSGISRDLDRFILRLLSREPTDRPGSAAEAHDELTRLNLSRDDTGAVPVVPVAIGEPKPSTPTRVFTFGNTERRWLGTTMVIVLIAAALGIAGALLGATKPGQGLLHVTERALGITSENSDSQTPPEGDQSSATVAVKADGPTLPLRAVRDADPFGDDGKEHPELLGNLVDGKASTAWTTQTYVQRDFGGKPGVGVILDRGASGRGKTISIDSSTPGYSLQVFTTDDDTKAVPAGWGAPTAQLDNVQANAAVDLSKANGRYVLLWITKLPDVNNGGYKVAINEVTLHS